MSWDIVLFNSKQIINTITELNKNLLEPTDFSGILENSFDRIKRLNFYEQRTFKQFYASIMWRKRTL
jgi:hypothetical protein